MGGGRDDRGGKNGVERVVKLWNDGMAIDLFVGGGRHHDNYRKSSKLWLLGRFEYPVSIAKPFSKKAVN